MIMSRNLELNESYLSTTVEAFEKFQAITMFEENEHIVLSNTLPAEHSNHVVHRERNDQLERAFDSGVMLLSNTDNDQYVNTSGLRSDEIVSKENSLSVSHEDTTAIKPIADESDLNNKNNDKLKSTALESTNIKQTGDEQSESIKDIQDFINNTEVSVSVKEKGRKLIKPRNEVAKISVESTTSGTVSPSSTLKLPIKHTKCSDSVTRKTKKILKKTGRPRKQPLKQKEIGNAKPANLLHVDSVVSSKVTKLNKSTIDQNCTPTQQKKEKGKKILKEDLSKTTNVETIKPVTNISTQEAKESTILTESLKTKTIPKRERAKKNSTKMIPTQPENQSMDITDSIDATDFDNEDDICLSRLNKNNNDTLNMDNTSQQISINKVLSTTVANKVHSILTSTKAIEEFSENKILYIDSNVSESEGNVCNNNSSDIVIQVEDDGDDMCLSKLKEIKETLSKNEVNEKLQTPSKRNSKKAIMSDFEYNIDSIVTDNVCQDELQTSDNMSLPSEEGSKRLFRRKTKQPLHYDEGSDEDPFAHVELSDEDIFKSKKSRYYSDDEYIPDGINGGNPSIVSSDSETNVADDDIKKFKRKKSTKKSDSISPKKKGKKCNTEKVVEANNIQQTEDVEDCLKPSLVKTNDVSNSQSNTWGTSNEFENFLAMRIQGTNLKIKKVSSKENAESTITPLQIPTINPSEPKKTVEMSSQTKPVATSVAAVQTSAKYDIPLKENISLNSEQAKQACDFLKSIVKTTAELGQLMTQKSNDFIKKKINVDNFTDSFKMDHRVKQTFLLFQLAKNNLTQMEEDLAQQYELFLHENKLSHCRAEPVELLPTVKDSDSDCEIVEEPVSLIKPHLKPYKKTEALPKFNPKTVFLNKELSIKIAKKPNEEKKLNIKGKHTVWINDSVMVKKVKPTQSFLAQDSRNKKPPDHKFVTLEMVSDFFDNYNYQKMLTICAQFTSQDWLTLNMDCICHYFIIKSDVTDSGNQNVTTHVQGLAVHPTEHIEIVSDTNPKVNAVQSSIVVSRMATPQTLLTLCVQTLQNHIYIQRSDIIASNNDPSIYQLADETLTTEPETLIQLSLKVLSNTYFYDAGGNSVKKVGFNICPPFILPSLTQLCYKRIKVLLFPITFSSESQYHCDNENNGQKDTDLKKTYDTDNFPKKLLGKCSEMQNDVIEIKSLFTLCVSFIQRLLLHEDNTLISNVNKSCKCRKVSPKSLKYITYKNIVYLLNINNDQHYNKQAVCDYAENDTNIPEDNEISEFFNINSVNTLSEEAFLNLNTVSLDIQEQLEDLQNFEDDNSIFSDHAFENDIHDIEDNLLEGSSWVSQVQMKELKSGIILTAQNSNNNKESEVVEKDLSIQVKLEQIDEISTNIDLSIVKTEHMPGLDEMTIIPENFVPKSEVSDCSEASDECIIQCNSSSYDATVFEEFLSSNKLITSQNMYGDEVFSQSALRVSGFHEPDYDSEFNTFDSLLIPQTYKALHVENAKNSLMESNSDDDNVNKKIERKKVEKRKIKRKNLKVPNKNDQSSIKEVDKSQSNNELTTITTRMRDKIRQKEKELASSDSEGEGDLNMNFKKVEDCRKSKIKKTMPTNNSEIQCNNVDSTQRIIETCKAATNNEGLFKEGDETDQTEFSSNSNHLIDQVSSNETLEETSDKTGKNIVNTTKESCSFPINYDGPVELLECEPTMPIFDNLIGSKSDQNSNNSIDAKEKPFDEHVQDSMNENNYNTNCIDRHGWKCYKIDCNDTKLSQNVKIILEKLPETFVETYIQYQNIMGTHEEDLEIERLTNLNSLNKSIRDNKSNITKRKVITDHEVKSEVVPPDTHCNNEEVNGDEPEHFDELTPSDEEDTNVDDQRLSLLPLKTPENNMAKDSLMNDNDSDDGTNIDKIKEEPPEQVTQPMGRPGPKSKKKVLVTNNSELMLTADKAMKKELSLLNGPVSFNNDAYIPSKDSITKKKQKTPPIKTYLTRERMKMEKEEEEDYSDEEEKRWFSTKEKLLRNTDKKGNASVSDAKHAKLVSEFIERRTEKTRKRKIFKCRRSRKKMLEQQKQLSVLYKELYGEPLESVTGAQSNDQRYVRRQRYALGQRKSVKVPGKKNQKSKNELAYPILFEESERTKRLHTRQAQLRQLLGCEENETVQVIEDKVCLEYDFETRKPVVSVHPFFTEVMKEHQYAGVKFMWDACFESLADIERGHLGSGCILAHCMGLGKTLQVLALIHTVMTHPRVGMRRVLVCCPLSTVLNWVDEIHKWIGPVTNKIKVFELSKLKKTYQRAYQLEDWFKGGGIFIIGYELFRSLTTLDPLLDDVRPNVIHKIRTALLDPGPDIIVCDEGHLLKNDYSILTMAMSRVATKRRIVLTGTPMQNNLREYYCMVNFIKPNLLGTYTEFYKRFENPIINGQHRDSTAEDTKLMNSCTYILHKVLEGCLQRQEVSVMYPYLPKKHEYTVFVTLTKYQWELYKHYMYKYAKEAKQNVLKDFHILQKIWSHPHVLHNFQKKSLMNKNKLKVEKFEDDFEQEDLPVDIKPTLEESWWLDFPDGGKMLDCIESSNKFLAVFRILEECVEIGNKVLIFSTSLFTLDSLEYFLKKINNWSLGQEYFRLDGSVPAEVRQKWCREFNAENNHKTKLFLISTRAGCLGLNMTAANRVIILDTSWNPAHDIQSIFRVYRFGQKRDCFIYRLVAMGTMEQKIYERSVTKQAVACRVLDEQLIDRHYNSADLNELYLYDETGMTVPGGVSMGVADAVVLRVARDAPIHAVQEHDSLLRGTSEQALPEHERTAAWNKFQQEHAQKQMEKKITKAQKQLKHSKESENMALDSNVDAVIEEDANVEAKVSSTAPTPVVKGGRKTVVTNCYIPIKTDDEPGPSKEPVFTLKNKALENIMVKKISTILMKYKYNNEEENKITELVNKVRNIIMGRSGSVVESADDELSSSIADILLQKEMSAPTLTDIMSKSIDNTFKATTPDDENKGQKRKNETTVEGPTIVSEELNELDNGKRKKRKAALAAEKCLELNKREDFDLHLASNETNESIRRSKRFELLRDNNSNSSKTNSKIYDSKNNNGDNISKPIKIVNYNENTNEKEIKKHQISSETGHNKKRKSMANDPCNSQINNLNHKDQSNTLNDSRRKLRKILHEEYLNTEPKKQLINLTATSENKNDNRMNRKNASSVETQSEDIIDLTEKSDSAFESVQKNLKNGNSKNHKQKLCNSIDSSRTTLNSINQKRSQEKNIESDKEIIPLHPSILKNENFIKIVAHKYLKDNPTMTQEVATLAAKHKVKAALEICESGKTFCSGDIYDKAVEILGMDMLKELHKMGTVKNAAQAKKPAVVVPARPAETTEDAISKALATNGSKKTVENVQNPDTTMGSFKVFQMRSKVPTNAAPPAVRPQQLNCDVVPVGLFKGPANIQATDNFHIVDEDECILPDDDNAAPSPSMASTGLRSQTMIASVPAVAPIRSALTIPVKVTSGPQRIVEKTQPVMEITTRTVKKSNRRKVTSVATPTPVDTNSPAVVVILSDDEDDSRTCPPALRPCDPVPVPVALTGPGDTHTSPPKLTLIRGHNSQPAKQIPAKLSLLMVNNDGSETTLHIDNALQQASSSTLLNTGTLVQATSSSSKSPLILRKLDPTKRPQSRKSTGPDKAIQEKHNLKNIITLENTRSHSVSTSNPKLQNPGQSKHESIFNDIVRIPAPKYLQNSNKTAIPPKTARKELMKVISVISTSTEAPSTPNTPADTSKPHCRILKILKTSEPPKNLQIKNMTKIPEPQNMIKNSTKISEPQNKVTNSTKRSEPSNKITNSTKRSEQPHKLVKSIKKIEPINKHHITNNAIIDLTDEPSTSNISDYNSVNKSISKSYKGPKNSKLICEKYDAFKNIILTRKDADKPVVINRTIPN